METEREGIGLEMLLRIAVRSVLGGCDFERLRRQLAELLEVGALEGMEWPEDAGEAPSRVLAWQLARFIWTKTPDPALDFRTRKLPEPGRNEPCPCGSGRKFKHCCRLLPDFGEAMANFSLLPYVLDCFARKELKSLPFDKLDPEELAHTASVWMEADRLRDAEALLEGYFRNVENLDGRAERAFDLLMDLYLMLHHPRKRKRLLEQALSSGDRVLRSAALHRKCVMLADRGETEAAWVVFTQAQREDPDNPSLSHLEVILLFTQGRLCEAAERARFWAARFRRSANPDHEMLVEWLERFADDPASMGLPAGLHGEPIERLQRLVVRAPAPVGHYRLEPEADDGGPLMSLSPVDKLEHEWFAMTEEGFDPWHDDSWLMWLERNPEALDSFHVLQGVVEFLEVAGPMEPVSETVRRALLERGVELLRIVLAANGAEGCRLEWGWLENRPALRLVAELAMQLREAEPGRALALMEWLVVTLNPGDNQGMRGFLAHLLVQLGQAAQAVALTDRYPDDFADMRYARVLALYACGREDEARRALIEARRAFPKVLKMLVAKNPRPVELQPFGVTVGGDDEAWFYRLNFRPVWEACGALEWARTVCRK